MIAVTGASGRLGGRVARRLAQVGCPQRLIVRQPDAAPDLRLAEIAVTDAGMRLASARIEEVAPDEAVARAVRALVDVGDYFIALARERIRPAPHEFQEKIAGPLRRLFERAQASGDIRADVPSSWLTESLVALVVGALSAKPSLGREDAIATITSMFLDGARGRPASTRAL